MAEDVRAASKQPNEPYDNAIGTGPLGAAMVSIDNQEILVTRDGIDWDIQPMPAEMAADGGGQAGDDRRRGRALRAGPVVGRGLAGRPGSIPLARHPRAVTERRSRPDHVKGWR